MSTVEIFWNKSPAAIKHFYKTINNTLICHWNFIYGTISSHFYISTPANPMSFLHCSQSNCTMHYTLFKYQYPSKPTHYTVPIRSTKTENKNKLRGDSDKKNVILKTGTTKPRNILLYKNNRRLCRCLRWFNMYTCDILYSRV